MTQKKIKAAVYSQVQLAEGIFSMWLGAGEMAKAAVPGQFIAVYPNDSARLLPRPISICETDPGKRAFKDRVPGGRRRNEGAVLLPGRGYP